MTANVLTKRLLQCVTANVLTVTLFLCTATLQDGRSMWVLPAQHCQCVCMCIYTIMYQCAYRYCTVLYCIVCIAFTTARTDYVAPIQGVSQQEVTRLVVLLTAETPALSPQLHGSFSAAGFSAAGCIYGLARPMR